MPSTITFSTLKKRSHRLLRELVNFVLLGKRNSLSFFQLLRRDYRDGMDEEFVSLCKVIPFEYELQDSQSEHWWKYNGEALTLEGPDDELIILAYVKKSDIYHGNTEE